MECMQCFFVNCVYHIIIQLKYQNFFNMLLFQLKIYENCNLLRIY